MKLTNMQYSFLKWLAMIVLPAAGVMYLGLADIWHLPYANQITSVIATVDAFLGIILTVSTAEYSIDNSIVIAGNNELMSDTTYDKLKIIAQVWLPAIATFYMTIGAAVGFPFLYVNEVVSTIMAIDLFLGAVLGFSVEVFYKPA